MATFNQLLFLLGSFIHIAIISTSGANISTHEVLFQWKELDYKWPSVQTREKLLKTKQFIPENNAIVGVKVFEDRVFITVPRWAVGIPSTFNVLKLSSVNGTPSSPPLEPYPSWEMQELGNCNAFQSVVSIEIDEFGRMWIIDVGRVTGSSPEPVKSCPAKLIIVDLQKDEILRKHEFPPEVVSPTSNFLNDLVVGCSERDKCWVYITDSTDAKLVVYNLEENKSWFVQHNSMRADPKAYNITILDVNYTFNTSIDGIALSPKAFQHDRVYYTPLSGFGLYSVSSSVLQVALNRATLRDEDVTVHTSTRSSQTDGLAMDSKGILFYGLLGNNSVAYVNTSQPEGFERENVLVANDEHLQWPDSFSFDNKGYLFVTSTRFHRYNTKTLNFTDVNFRVGRVFTGSRSYVYFPEEKNVNPPEATNTPQNLGSNALDEPTRAKGTGLYVHDYDEWNIRLRDAEPHIHIHQNPTGKGPHQPPSSTPTVNEKLSVVLLSVLLYNPALLVQF